MTAPPGYTVPDAFAGLRQPTGALTVRPAYPGSPPDQLILECVKCGAILRYSAHPIHTEWHRTLKKTR